MAGKFTGGSGNAATNNVNATAGSQLPPALTPSQSQGINQGANMASLPPWLQAILAHQSGQPISQGLLSSQGQGSGANQSIVSGIMGL